MIFGAVTCDTAAYVETLPKGNEEPVILNTEQRLSGSGYYTARILKGLNLPYDLVAPAGSGVYGDYVREKTAAEGIPMEYISEEMNGSTYHMIDKEGRQSAFVVPGCEYEYDFSYTEYADSEEISAVVLYTDMLYGEGGEDLLDFISRLDCPVYTAFGMRKDELDLEISDTLLDLKPELFLTVEEACTLSGQQDLHAAMDDLLKRTQMPIIVIAGKDGLLYLDEEMQLRAPGDDILEHVDMISANVCFTAYISARTAGVDVRNSLMFAAELTSRELKNKHQMDEFDWNVQKKRLAGMITYE